MEKITPLGSEESIFSNIDSLEPGFLPPLMPYRENEIKEIAASLEPLLKETSGRNLLITGKAGIGKTHAVKKVLQDFLEESDNAFVFYVNCWTHSSGREVFEDLCSQLKISRPSDLTESQLLNRILARLEERPAVLCFDEIDRAGEFGFLYSSLEEFKVKSIILISNKTGFLAGLDERIRSRLLPKEIFFRGYTKEEISGILRERRKYAFFEDTWSKKAIELVEEKSFEKGDLRFAIQLLKLAGLKAEGDVSRIVREEHVKEALKELML